MKADRQPAKDSSIKANTEESAVTTHDSQEQKFCLSKSFIVSPPKNWTWLEHQTTCRKSLKLYVQTHPDIEDQHPCEVV